MKIKTARIISTYDPKRNGNKYGNKKTEIDGILFDSKKEASRWIDLKFLLQAGEIRNLQRQVRFEILPADPPRYKRPLVYVADFVYEERAAGSWRRVVEDVKSEATKENKVYKMKKRLLWQQEGIEIREV